MVLVEPPGQSRIVNDWGVVLVEFPGQSPIVNDWSVVLVEPPGQSRIVFLEYVNVYHIFIEGRYLATRMTEKLRTTICQHPTTHTHTHTY
jgi:hypothetical protein